MPDERRTPSRFIVRDHWAATSLWRIKGFASLAEFEEDDRCFACRMGFEGTTMERAHIIPRVKGGPDDASNLHMLCWLCHKDSEFLETPETYWAWFWERTYMDRCISQLARNGTNVWSMLEKSGLLAKSHVNT